MYKLQYLRMCQSLWYQDHRSRCGRCGGCRTNIINLWSLILGTLARFGCIFLGHALSPLQTCILATCMYILQPYLYIVQALAAGQVEDCFLRAGVYMQAHGLQKGVDHYSYCRMGLLT